MADSVVQTSDELMEVIAELNELIKQSHDEFLDEWKECESKNPYGIVRVEDSEKHLKKLIKHAKTPMERKMYEKQLNALYKKRKQK